MLYRTSLGLMFAGAVWVFASAASAQIPDLIISEYVEGTSYNKAIELFNGTGGAIVLDDGPYELEFYFNGSSIPGVRIELTGVIHDGGTFVLAEGRAADAVLQAADQTSTLPFFNGNDAVVLTKDGVAIDSLGQVGHDPGSAGWGSGGFTTTNHTLRRKASVCFGDTDPADVFDPAIEWEGFPVDTFDGLGSHEAQCFTPSRLGLRIRLDAPPLVLAGVEIELAVEMDNLGGVAAGGTSVRLSLPAGVTYVSNDAGGDCVGCGAGTGGMLSIDGGPLGSGQASTAHIVARTRQDLAPGTDLRISATASSTMAGGQPVTNTVMRDLRVDTRTHIFDVQGSGMTSPMEGAAVIVEGVVVGDFQGPLALNGFFLQEVPGDGDPATSDGIFVSTPSGPNVNEGERVRATGTVRELSGQTSLTNVSRIDVLGVGAVVPADVTLPVAAISDFEAFEGMLVTFPQTLTVTETHNLHIAGELWVSADGRLHAPTNVVSPGPEAAAMAELNTRLRLLVDDGSMETNLDYLPHADENGTRRLGSTVDGLTGVMSQGGGRYRLHPTIDPAFVSPERPAASPSVGGSLRIGVFNVYNYFTTIDDGSNQARGADSEAERFRQRVKLVAALTALDGDIVALAEVENNDSALADLVAGLNEATAPGTYAFVADPVAGRLGTDRIKNAIIYRPSRVIPVNAARTDLDPIHSRPPLAQLFQDAGSGARFHVVANHFKSKSCWGASGSNTDQGDGQACFNARRVAQAERLLVFVASLEGIDGSLGGFVVGDFNAHTFEDPIMTLIAGGLIHQTLRVPPPDRYSFVFQGEAGVLDHVFSTAGLDRYVTGVSFWHANADEPRALDYNDDVLDIGESPNELNPPGLYTPDPFRASDHDAMVVGVSFARQQATVSRQWPDVR